MSKQMSRDEAYELIYLGIEMGRLPSGPKVWSAYRAALNKHDGEPTDILCTALSILAPEPRTEPPGVDEVGDEEMCWVKNNEYSWYLYDGGFVRNIWGERYLKAWLPLSALPMPKATDGTATFEKGEG